MNDYMMRTGFGAYMPETVESGFTLLMPLAGSLL